MPRHTHTLTADKHTLTRPAAAAAARTRTRPYRTLLACFAAWKLFLLAIALGSSLVGDVYDTSAALVVVAGAGSSSSSSSSNNSSSRDDDGGGGGGGGGGHGGHVVVTGGAAGLGTGLVARLSSWDAVYFVSIARRGYRFEQEWAFGAGQPAVVRAALKGLAYLGITSPSAAEAGGVGGGGAGAVSEALAGIAVANVAHLLSALVLYLLGQVVWRDQVLSLVSALLHILSPAGLFLSAPYAESAFALLSFSGYLLLALSCRAEHQPTYRDLYVVVAGVVLGLATTFRSNGILNGIPFAWEAVRTLARLPRTPADTVSRLLALAIGGVCVAAGSIAPQAVAYLRFCSDASGAHPTRPWCQGYLPSIYTFVQQHYWNVGFLRYWTVSNLPLFLLATPMATVLVRSGLEHLTAGRRPPTAEKPAEAARLLSLVQSTAAAQVLLAVLALTTYHVQIVTRISSGYPLWYWWLAGRLGRGDKAGSRLVVFMVMYASIQGALFASFLPPA